jgi:hypothetical protein
MTTKQRNAQNAANARREAKRAAHAAMMRKHEAHRAAIAVWTVAYEGWRESGCKGPRPIHPQDVGTGWDRHCMAYDNKMGYGLVFLTDDEATRIKLDDDTMDLVSAAAELGIDIDR